MTQIPPPLDPGNPGTRLLRVIFGACPDCDHDEESHHDGNDYGSTHHCRECEGAGRG